MRKIQIGGKDGVCAINKNSLSSNDSFVKIAYIDTSSITQNHIANKQIIDLIDAPSRAQRKVKKDTIIYSTVRPNLEHYGILSNPEDNLIVSTGFATLDVIDANICPKYLYYLITQPCITNYLHVIATGRVSAYPSINPSDIANLMFSVPNRKRDQERIANVLSILDDKIELNNKIKSELETVAKLLYDYWFVQFNFPDKNGKPYKSSGGKMVYNDELKREIPEQWQIDKIANLIQENKGGDWGKENSEKNYTYKVSCVRGADINYLNGNKTSSELPTRYILAKNDAKILCVGDVIIEISGGSPTQSTGRIALLTEKTLERFDNPLICSNFCQAVTLKDAEYSIFFFYLWKMFYDNGVFFNYEGKTSGIKNLLFDMFAGSTNWHIPPIHIVEKFNIMANRLFNKKELLLKQNEELIKLRDWLLPILMNGQVKVK